MGIIKGHLVNFYKSENKFFAEMNMKKHKNDEAIGQSFFIYKQLKKKMKSVIRI